MLSFQKIKEHKEFLFILVAVLFVILFPVFQIFLGIGPAWQGVPPEYTNDALFYYARMREVADGNFLLGHPYFLEHSKQIAPSFFVPDWLGAIPLFLGFSVVGAIIFDNILWGLIFVILAYLLFASFGISKKWSALFSFLAYLQIFDSMLKPANKQVIFAGFLIFLLAFFNWLRDCYNKRNIFYLAITSAFAFYLYPYLGQIIALIFLLVFIYLLVKKRNHLTSFLKTALLIFLFSIPFIFYSVKQVLHPFYFESMKRMGLVSTHIPSIEVFYYGRWIILGLILWGLVFRGAKTVFSKVFLEFFTITGAAILFLINSTFIIGKDFEVGTHVGRFVIIWFTVAFLTLLFFLLKNQNIRRTVSFFRGALIAFLIILGIIGMLRNTKRFLPFENFEKQQTLEIQEFAEPLKWLDRQSSSSKVVWSNNHLFNLYVPVLTKHYVLFPGKDRHFHLHMASSEEIEERYLFYNYFEELSHKDLEEDFSLYSGPGKSAYILDSLGREINVYRFLKLEKRRLQKEKELSMFLSNKEKEIERLYEKYLKEIKPNPDYWAKKFKVDYFVEGLESERDFSPMEVFNCELVYQDDKFLIYRYLK